MSRIRVLSPQVAAQIAAGEVITRPAAVVKELVENALDAGARTITVEVEEGGLKLIRVVDDGCGMTLKEARLSLQRHATSKLSQETDLLRVATLGFRGEALPSIAAVSRLTLITCPPGAALGGRLVARGGEVLEAGPWAGAPGTQVSVAELFFNTPARRKFLKSPQAEQAYLVELVRHLALGYPEVHFQMRTPARTLLAAPAPQSLTERVAALQGAELASRMLPLSLAQGPWQVTGLLSEPEFSLASARFQVFLVNRRVVQDRLLAAVLKEVFAGLLPRGRHPAAVLTLTLPPEEVDVNVHPAKSEIRFREPGRVYGLLLAALRQALGPLYGRGTPYTVHWQPEPGGVAESRPAPLPPEPQGLRPPLPFPGPGPAPAWPPAAGPRGFAFADLRIIGQLQHTYILAQGPQGLILIDQHAAHERLLYEALKSREPGQELQQLLFPRVVEVPPSQADWVRSHLAVLAGVGLVLEDFGGASFLLTAAPACLAASDLEGVVGEAVNALAPLKSQAPAQEVREQALQFLACRGAIKAGDALKEEQMQALLRQLDGLAVAATCPHGRPLWRLISYEEIRQSFHRPR